MYIKIMLTVIALILFVISVELGTTYSAISEIFGQQCGGFHHTIKPGMTGEGIMKPCLVRIVAPGIDERLGP